jgi:hypothetical protein
MGKKILEQEWGNMLLVEPMVSPELLITEFKRKCLTHVAFCLTVIPFAYWPVKANIVKGYLDEKEVFHPIIKSRERIFLSRQEFQELVRPDLSGQSVIKLDAKALAKLILAKMNADKRAKQAVKKKVS